MRAELEPLGRSYDVVVANPPYMGAKNMNKWLSGWVKDNFPDVKGDLFSCFMVRNSGMGSQHAQMGFMTPYVWMFIGTYEKLRRFVIEQNTITSLIQLEYSGFAGATVPICTFTLQKGKVECYRGGYIRLSDFPGADQQAPRALEALANPGCGWFYRRDADSFRQIPGSPIAYWASDVMLGAFTNGISIDEVSDYTGSPNITGDNGSYLRLFWEVSSNEVSNKWVPYSKGGEFRRWYGNLIHVVDWTQTARQHYASNQTSTLLPEKYWYKGGITYTMLTSGKACFRHIDNGCIWDKSGPVICSLGTLEPIWLAYLNGSVAQLYLDFLNPTMNLQVKDVKSLPFLPIDDSNSIISLTRNSISISKGDWDSFEISRDFKRHPLI